MDLSKKFAFCFGATALIGVAATIVLQMVMPGVGSAILVALLVAPILALVSAISTAARFPVRCGISAPSSSG